MPRYQVVNAATFVGNNLRAVGEIIEHGGWPGSTLEPQDDVAKRIKEYFAAHRRDRKLPRVPDLAKFADPVPEPAKPNPVKDDTDG